MLPRTQSRGGRLGAVVVKASEVALHGRVVLCLGAGLEGYDCIYIQT